MAQTVTIFIEDETIRITKDGRWLSGGPHGQHEITHDEMLRAFKRSVRRDAEGYFIQIGRETKRIEVEDTAFFVELAWKEGSGRDAAIRVRVSDGEERTLDPRSLRLQGTRLTMPIREGGEEARFLAAAYHWTLLNLEDAELRRLKDSD